MVEAAIIIPLLLLASFAVMEFGVLFYVNLALENGVSQAVRYGITGGTMNGMTREASIQAIMRSETPTLTIDDSAFHFSHLVGGNWVNGMGGAGSVEKLTVTYNHQVLVLRPLFGGASQVTLQVESTMKSEDRFN
jgi:Flp pilus assembly protein TadG